ncbi:DUF4129 domain-containing protein [Paenibacillus eucommiae]|uniref:Protein-glutamine gamma-glutamyltransferase-like C-terminal domain-containing protein n=1 Tax=Paenibacillus eucommiae TaxID=1355755 RepID=A0ABS4ITI8_9BACL|nr:DUF4129 domain-containing protein [Paenibacillus eucommiae]MBP1990891.1 hypothetical protein [Paenibacillus eucommiae]
MSSLQQLSEDKEKLKQILSKDEYTAYTRSEGWSFRELLRWLWRKFLGLFPDLQMSKGVGSLLTYGLLLIVLAVIVFAIYWFSKQLLRQGRVRMRSYLPEGELSRSYSYYWQQAAEYGAAGNWREGIRSVFLSLLFYLEAQKHIRVEKWKTNWEYADELAGAEPSLVPLLHDCSLLFERVWYGKQEANEAIFAAIYERAAQLLEKGADDQDAQA